MTSVVFALIASVFLTACVSIPAPALQPPNILVVYTDDQSYKTVSAYPGSPDWVDTPNIDALAQKGVRVAKFYPGTWCMPSRASFLTGRHSYGINSLRMEGPYPGAEYDPSILKFWPEVFRHNGYYTGQIGKWHVATDTGFGRDWDYQAVWNRPKYQSNAGAYYHDQLIETNGSEGLHTPGYSTDNYTKWAVDFINGETRDVSKPWFLWVAYSAAHKPITPAKRHLQRYAGTSTPLPADVFPPRAGKPTYASLRNEWEVVDGEVRAKDKADWYEHGDSFDSLVRQYNETVAAVDEGVGDIIAALDATGQLDNTLVVFTSDQGMAWGEHGFYATKVAPYDANIRAPLVVSLPGQVAEGQVFDAALGGVDLIPTLFDFAGIDLPWAMHGHSFRRNLKQPELAWSNPTLQIMTSFSFGENTSVVPTVPEERDLLGVPWWVSLVDGQYKYIRTLVAGEPEELYHLGDDPDELHNLAFDSTHHSKVLAMRAATIAELERTDAGFLETLPSVASLKSLDAN